MEREEERKERRREEGESSRISPTDGKWALPSPHIPKKGRKAGRRRGGVRVPQSQLLLRT